LITLGGLAIGGLAMGGWSMGFLALGGGAIGWKFATGGLAVAREFALGGLALADHANDEAARTFLRENLVASGLTHLMQHARWLVLLALLPVFLGMRRSWTRKEAGTGRGSRSA
jgi:hypothetical protein